MNLLSTNLMGLGVGGAALASAIGIDITSAATATGSSEADAYALTTTVTEFTTTASSTGAKLPSATPGAVCVVANFGANTLKVYPNTSDKINNGTATTGSINVAANKTGFFLCIDSVDWVAVVTA